MRIHFHFVFFFSLGFSGKSLTSQPLITFNFTFISFTICRLVLFYCSAHTRLPPSSSFVDVPLRLLWTHARHTDAPHFNFPHLPFDYAQNLFVSSELLPLVSYRSHLHTHTHASSGWLVARCALHLPLLFIITSTQSRSVQQSSGIRSSSLWKKNGKFRCTECMLELLWWCNVQWMALAHCRCHGSKHLCQRNARKNRQNCIWARVEMKSAAPHRRARRTSCTQVFNTVLQFNFILF